MASFIHGFRVYQFARCEKSNSIVLQGSAGMHLHTRVQKAAECRGISLAMWMTQMARERQVERIQGGPAVPHEGAAPDWDCTCGHYFYRTYDDVQNYAAAVYAHVTCLERTVLHTAGGRTTQYSVDYLLAPSEPNMKAYVLTFDPAKAHPGNRIVPMPMFAAWGYQTGMGMAEEFSYDELLEAVAENLGVPILAKDDLQGCPECLLVNGWRQESEISGQMRRNWFGEGYSS